MSKFPSKIKRGVGKGLLYLLMTTPLFFNCQKEEIENLEPEKPEAIFENVEIVPKNKLEEISKIDSAGTISFEKAQDYKTGDVLVGGISEKTPGGILKKITEISEDGTKAKTVNASLDEAIKEGGFSYSQNFDLGDFKQVKSIEGLKYGKSDFNFEFDEVVFDLDGDFSTEEDQIKIKGNIYFDIQTEIDANFGFRGINFSFENQITEKSSLEAIATAKFIDFDKEVRIFHASGTPFQIPGAPIPLIARPEFELYLGTKGELKSELKSKLENDFEFFGGIYYDKGWTSKSDWSNEFIFYEPEVSIKGELEAYCKPKLNLIINEIAGPGAGMKGYLEMEVDNNENPWWNLYGGYDVFLGISSGWLTKSFGSYEENVLEFREKIKDSGENVNLEAKLSVSPQEGFLPLEILFDASNSTGEIVEYYFNFGNGEEHVEKKGEEGFDGIFNYVYESKGNYETSLKVKDESGKTDSKNLEVIVNEPAPPVADFGISPESGNEETVFSFDASLSEDDEDSFDNLLFRWDFQGDGVWETDFNKEYLKDWKYETYGNYVPTLEVKDSRGLVSKIEKNLEVEGLTEDVFVDKRDGEEYKIVKIGDDWWFADNLRYEAENSVYYNNDEQNKIYGRLYPRIKAVRACPEGWSLPSRTKWCELTEYFEENENCGLLSNTGYEKTAKGLKDKNFTNIGGGYFHPQDGFIKKDEFNSIWISTYFASTTDTLKSFRFLEIEEDKISNQVIDKNENYKFYVRPVKDR